METITLFTYSLSSIYLVGFIVSVLITIIYLLLSDFLEAIFSVSSGPTSPVTLILSFLSMLCGFSYIGEYLFTWNSIFIFVISFFLSLIAVLAMKMLILKPIAEAEQNTVHRMGEFIGCVGEVTTTIPKFGIGEVFLSSQVGGNALLARNVENQEVTQGDFVVIEGIEDGVLLVRKKTNKGEDV
ncbi:NfeD family protein [Bacillus manliponensis]